MPKKNDNKPKLKPPKPNKKIKGRIRQSKDKK
jgi:hypothetical protein